MWYNGAMDALKRSVRATIDEHRLIRPGETVVAGVSGGPDSVCLLDVLNGLRLEYGFALHAAHLHHGLRGSEADKDAAHVRRLAGRLGLPCTVEQLDVIDRFTDWAADSITDFLGDMVDRVTADYEGVAEQAVNNGLAFPGPIPTGNEPFWQVNDNLIGGGSVSQYAL